MPPRTEEARIIAALRRRIQQFYEYLNRGEFEKCYHTLDPRLCANPASVTLYQYVSSLERFRTWYGAVKVLQVGDIRLHLHEPNRLYDERDFALAEVTWEDQAGQRPTLKERWVRDQGRWYTRCTGLVTPSGPPGPGER